MNTKHLTFHSLILLLLVVPVPALADKELDEPLIHSVVNDGIRTIMHDLDRLMMKRNMSSLMIMEMQVEYLQ